MLALHFFVEAPEEIFCHGLGRTIDQPLTQLGDLAPHRGMHRVGQLATTFVGRQLDLGAAFAEPGWTALPLKRELVAGRRIDVAEGDLAAEFGRHRPDFATAITAYPPADAYDFAVVSTGSNDPLSPRLYADLAKLRERLHARRVLWVIPMHRRARQYVALEASYSHDMTQTFTPAPDGIHPLSYPSLGASIRSQLNDGTK